MLKRFLRMLIIVEMKEVQQTQISAEVAAPLANSAARPQLNGIH
jgi:hypothetical protein